jgi:transposase, IS5 family
MPEGISHQRPTTMHQRSFASAEFALKKKRTRREVFLAEMERVVPWSRLEAVIEPLYPKSGRVGRQPIGVSRMLRMYCLQQWYGLADEALEDALYDSQALRDFVGIDLSRESVPDATTLLKFRRLLLEHDLTRALFEEINAHLAERGLLMRAGTIVDATIIAAPSSTKNSKGERDPDMHQAKKGNQWHFGMKAHIGVDAESGLVHNPRGSSWSSRRTRASRWLCRTWPPPPEAPSPRWPMRCPHRSARRAGRCRCWPFVFSLLNFGLRVTGRGGRTQRVTVLRSSDRAP